VGDSFTAVNGGVLISGLASGWFAMGGFSRRNHRRHR
jgi:hypothetical protein